MRTFILAAATALTLSTAPAFAAEVGYNSGYALQDAISAQAGEHVVGNLTLEGQPAGDQQANGQQQVQINALRSQDLGTYLWAPSQGNGN